MLTIYHLDHVSAEVELELPMPMRLFVPGSLPTYCQACLEPVSYRFSMSGGPSSDIRHIEAHTDSVLLLCGAVRTENVGLDD